MIDHPLAHALARAAYGTFPPADGVVEVHPAAGDRVGVVAAFTGHFVIAADADPAEVEARAPTGEFSIPLSGSFLAWLGEVIGATPGVHDVVLATLGVGGGAADWLEPSSDVSHPRVERARRYRSDVNVWTAAEGGVVTVGRGLCDRWEVAFEVDRDARNAGLGRRLVAAARALLPAGEPMFAQVAPGNAASLRTMTAAGFQPIGAEVLFHRA